MISIAGVPEHFNYPWQLLHKESDKPLFSWVDVPEGTGRMKEMLAAGEIDCALMLTEGAVKAISEGLKARILQLYVSSPLYWGVHLGDRQEVPDPQGLAGMKAAISRPGSGSHLMAFLYAKHMGWEPGDLEFVTINTLKGALEYLKTDRNCFFLWEKFTTQPHVDAGHLVRADVFPTPWPCFVWVCSEHALGAKWEELRVLREGITPLLSSIKERAGLNMEIAEFYGLEPGRVAQWLELTDWGLGLPERELLQQVQSSLRELGLMDGKLDYSALVWLDT